MENMWGIYEFKDKLKLEKIIHYGSTCHSYSKHLNVCSYGVSSREYKYHCILGILTTGSARKKKTKNSLQLHECWNFRAAYLWFYFFCSFHFSPLYCAWSFWPFNMENHRKSCKNIWKIRWETKCRWLWEPHFSISGGKKLNCFFIFQYKFRKNCFSLFFAPT